MTNPTNTAGEMCNTCLFYRQQSCRRFPPAKNSHLGGLGGWHGVKYDDWCGEYRANQLNTGD